jgi:outer membrane protein assembly factor BamE
MRHGPLLAAACIALCALSACTSTPVPGLGGLSVPRPKVPRVFRVSIQQGNIITQAMVDQLEPGMTKAQVEYVLGEPVLHGVFRSDRWNYFSSLSLGDRVLQRQTLSLYFEDDRLAFFEGDLVPTDTATEEAPAAGEDASTDTAAAGSPPNAS